jgi:uncharacterized lipoprotein YmbA
MGGRIARLILIASFTAQALGCASTSARFYSLNSTATATGAPAERATVMVGPVSIPAAVDQPEFVVQVTPNRVDVDEFNRWDAPLNDSIARVVAGDLALQLGSPNVTTAQLANFNPSYWVTIDVRRFESVRGEAATVDAVWVVRRTTGKQKTRSGRTVAREAVQGDSFDALAAAHSRALTTVSSDIAAAIRAEASETRQAAARVPTE